MEEKKKILIIGAGLAGMHAIKEFSSSNLFEVTCKEQLASVGGLWNYCDVNTDESDLVGSRYSAVYKNLSTNVPWQIMTFCGVPFPDGMPSYVKHADVKEYLWKIAEKYQLNKYIEFNTKVLSVKPKEVFGREDAWKVESINVVTKEKKISQFDIVIVCSGMHSKPFIPIFEGIKDFKGKIMHFCDYRDPNDYSGKNVLVVGGSYSGIDVALELKGVAKKIWLSMRNTVKKTIPEVIEQIGEIVKIEQNKIILHKYFGKDDDETMKKELLTLDNIDVIILCTGYQYSFPFLSADCGVSVLKPDMLSPLYNDTICLSRQTLAFIGVCKLGNTLIFEYKARFLRAFYEGKFQLPPYGKELLEMIEKYNERRKEDDERAEQTEHKIPIFVFRLCEELAAEGGFEPLDDKYGKLFLHAITKKMLFETTYKNFNYEFKADGEFVERLED